MLFSVGIFIFFPIGIFFFISSVVITFGDIPVNKLSIIFNIFVSLGGFILIISSDTDSTVGVFLTSPSVSPSISGSAPLTSHTKLLNN